MGRGCAAFWTCLLLWGCSGPEVQRESLRGRTVLDRLPEVASGIAVNPDSLILSIDREGAVYREGMATDLKEIQEFRQHDPMDYRLNRDPVLLEVHPDLRVLDFIPLLEQLIHACRVHVSFLVETPAGRRALSLPIRVDTCCLHFFDGDHVHKEGDHPRKYAWMHMALLPEGRILLKKIRIGEEEKEPRFLILPSKDHPEPGKIRRPPPEPPVGEFDPASLEEFVNKPRHDDHSYFAHLEIQHEDSVEEMLRFLSELKMILGRRVLVGIPGKPAVKNIDY